MTIQEASETRGATGAILRSSWTNVATLRVSVGQQGGAEVQRARIVIPEATMVLEGHWQSGIKPGMRALLNGSVLDIKAVVNMEEGNRFMRLICTEGAGTA